MNTLTPAPVDVVAAEAPAPFVPNPFQRRILAGLNVARAPRLLGPLRVASGHIYGGTVDPAVVARRRAANRAARRARAMHRRAACWMT
ncbi:hypothetical protein HOU70_gp58 [Arthrobacter phage Liebe]|uniref:Uncharacterized protein n=2 Tax=Arthrobacter virus Liebe TaxID=2734245 RepID=A0A3G2KHT7_9CAUD|nr:hypothetical protein HOU70_gp58 [Arthrobacter phage Liebe]AYN58539.1 hypothetical protein PBI_MAUREEN_58 [Arthrobacter phage Maureen]AZF93791.1 hypothetical protein PBI_LIEBE_58 [Arthrobacter phage Liebe]